MNPLAFVAQRSPNFVRLAGILSLFFAHLALAGTDCPTPWLGQNGTENCDLVDYKGHQIRAGYFPEDSTLPFLGNVIYLQGLGDSMLNHAPLFKMISNLGFRVLAFDYPGQGGSSGSMNSTRIDKIIEMATLIQKKYARAGGKFSDTILGWSTGGLAAYKLAALERFKRVIMITPGIAPKLFVGEGFPTFEITIRTLTRNLFRTEPDPHIDPIRPTSPLKVPLFSQDLLRTARASKAWRINPKIKGLVLLSSTDDTYTDPIATMGVLQEKAPHFLRRWFLGGSLHELDNEIPEVSENLRSMIANFLQKE